MNAVQNSQNDTDRLVELAAAGRADAVDELLARHRQRLRRMIAVRLDARLGTRVDPSDVVQETLFAAHRKLAAYLRNPVVPFHAWLRQLAWDRLNELHRFHFRERRSVDREQRWTPAMLSDESALSLVGGLTSGRSTPGEQAVRYELLRRVREALARLRETDREILIMRHLEELSVQEVATILGIAEGTVKSRHFRALEKLKGLLHDD
jgi:RNA polymerase sigma-70 factor (ECF subfamily)